MQKKFDLQRKFNSIYFHIQFSKLKFSSCKFQFTETHRGRAIKCRFTELLFSEFALMFVTTSFTAHSPHHVELLCVEPARQDIKSTVILTDCSQLWYLRVFCAGEEIGRNIIIKLSNLNSNISNSVFSDTYVCPYHLAFLWGKQRIMVKYFLI